MLGVVINLFAVTSMGILLACFAGDMPQLGILMILVLLPMQILSGGTTPQSSMPAVIRYVMQLAPTTHFVEFGKAILFRGADFAIVWPIFLKMAAIGAAFFLLALRTAFQLEWTDHSDVSNQPWQLQAFLSQSKWQTR